MNTFRDSFGNLDIVDVRPWQAALFDAIRFPEKLKTYISTIIGMFLNCNDIDVQYTKIISILLYRKVIIPFLENLHITFIMNTNIMPTPTTLLPDQNTLLDSITFQHGNDAEQLSNSIRDMLVAQHTIGLVTDANDYANIIRAGFKLIQIRIISVLSQLRHINMNNNIITLRATIDLLLTKIKQLKVSTQDDHNLNIAKTTEIINLRKEIKKLKEEIGLARQDYDVKSKLAVETGGALIDLQVLLDGLRAKILLLEERINIDRRRL